jgi:hypothetical protein
MRWPRLAAQTQQQRRQPGRTQVLILLPWHGLRADLYLLAVLAAGSLLLGSVGRS